MVKSNLAASTSTTKKSVKKTKTTSKKKTSDSETKAKLVADGQKIIASAVQAAVQKTPHGRGYRNATVKLQIPSKAIALATLQANRPGNALQKITEKIYYVIGGKHFPEKKVHKALGLKAAPIYCSKPFTGHINLFVGENPPAWSKKPPVVVYEAKITFVSDNSMIIKTHSEMVSKHAWE